MSDFPLRRHSRDKILRQICSIAPQPASPRTPLLKRFRRGRPDRGRDLLPLSNLFPSTFYPSAPLCSTRPRVLAAQLRAMHSQLIRL